MNIWRLNIKTDSVDINPRQFCFNQSIMGLGWSVESKSKHLEWDEYYEKAHKNYKEERNDKGWWRALNAIKNRVKINDLCWSRDLNGIYYLGRITGEWQYINEEINRKADIVNVRPIEWVRVGENDSVPGTIVNRFIRGGTLEKVNGATTCEFSKFLYNQLTDDEFYEFKHIEADFFSLIHSDDCEDIIGLLLQDMGYQLIPSSCKKSTVNYEFVLKHKKDGHKAVAQVKKGKEDLIIENYKNLDCKVYLFTTKGRYIGKSLSNVFIIDIEKVERFIRSNWKVLPDKVQTWINIRESLN
ncbi:hypothetical protein A8B79_02430 [Balneola sp. EhC07]|uniref:hypothetical protein n=1 Tax=Balneola sp. EhC07 TaxID=1849360 RepID=UPI0007F3D36E|nr:hypothetical protein [Balneola sp. EhC07]OAN62427.1 hypothetical protein A8B79_02430 [Balneola sp. EhC07]